MTIAVRAVPSNGARDDALELTILMPCLNEGETIGACVREARQFLGRSNISGEILIADNGSSDGSVAIAEGEGARVVHVPVRGYGSAIMHGIRAARGRFVIFGDADGSYDFLHLDVFLERLRGGDQLVMGNRFRGGIDRGAMPFLHRYLGNPVLSFLGRLFFDVPIGDFHCGLRGIERQSILASAPHTPGFEYASEMVIRARMQGLRISEVPTTLRPDGRSRPPHLRTWTDGWRHLRLLLLHSPRWLFLIPGAVCFAIGLLLTVTLYTGPLTVLNGIRLDVHSLIIGCLLMLVGAQSINFAVIGQRYGQRIGLLTGSKQRSRGLTLEKLLLIAAALIIAGMAGIAHSVVVWSRSDFGNLDYASLVKPVMLSGTALALGCQVLFTAFLAALIDSDPRDRS